MIKPWILFACHVVAATTSFLCCTFGSLLVGALAWNAGALPSRLTDGPLEVFALPLLCLGFGASATLGSGLSASAALRLTQRARWKGFVAPVLVACAATVALATLNALGSWGWSSVGVEGVGAGVGAAFGSYFAPLRWALERLPRLDERVGTWRRGFKPVPPRSRTSRVSVS